MLRKAENIPKRPGRQAQDEIRPGTTPNSPKAKGALIVPKLGAAVEMHLGKLVSTQRNHRDHHQYSMSAKPYRSPDLCAAPILGFLGATLWSDQEKAGRDLASAPTCSSLELDNFPKNSGTKE
jgi:hypothetical protein